MKDSNQRKDREQQRYTLVKCIMVLKYFKRAVGALMLATVIIFGSACGQAPESAATDGSASTEASATNSIEVSTNQEASSGALGAFSVSSIDGEEYTQGIFADHDLTLVNVMATWCGPCVAEMPELEKLSNAVADKGVAIIGIVQDTSYKGEVDEDAVSTAKQLQESTGVTYPLLIPDANGFNGLLDTVDAFPTTYFIGKDGQQVAKPAIGSMNYESWQKTVDSVLASME